MKLQKRFILRFMTVFFFTNVVSAAGGVIRIPLNTFMKPASDLNSKEDSTCVSDLARCFQQDPKKLSTINPIENKYWQNQKYSAKDLTLHAQMPQPETGVQLDSDIGANRELGIYSVIIKTQKNEKYVLTLGQQVHASLLKAALLRKMGYFQESPRYYSKIKINFPNAEQKEAFINRAFCENGPSEESTDCLSISPFKTDTNKKEYLSHAGELGLNVHGVYLEKMNAEVPSLFDGLTPASPATLPYFSQSRAFRSLLVPFVIGDMGESINRVSTQSVTVASGIANINYGFDHYFESTDASDVIWALRRLRALTEQDWNEIIEASEYPRSIRQLVKAKMLYRAENMIEAFFKKEERQNIFSFQIPDIKYSSSDGVVENGKIMTENIPGFPQRFSNGDRQSPFESGDFLRYMKIKGVSSALTIGLNKLQEKLNTNINHTLRQQIDGFLVSRHGVQTIGNITGLNAGLNYGVSRQLTTGTFYGSTAPIQLVDNASFSSSIGLMHVINELHGLGVSIGGNVSYNRDFTHVRPVSSIKEGAKANSEEIFKILKGEFTLRKLGKLLETGKLEGTSDGFVSFMSELKSGEVFLITDSIGAGAQVGVNVGLDNLVGFYAGVFTPSIGLTAGGSKVLLRQIQIMKTDDGLQIFIRNQNSKAFSLMFDANYFVNLLKIKAETVKTDLHTDAFILNYSGDLVSKGDSGEIDLEGNPDLKAKYEEQKKFGHKVAGALRGLIYQSSADKLYANFRFQQFEIDHMLKTDTIKKKILWYRSTKLQEEHLVKIFKPEVNIPEGSTAVNAPIEVIAYRKGELRGSDKLGFGIEGADSLMSYYWGGYAPALSQSSQNPTQVPFGKAEWRIIKTETEISPQRIGQLPSISSIQNVWGGWSIKREKVEKILTSVKERIKGTEYDGSELIPDHVLHNVKKLDFFKITSNLTLLPDAMVKVKELVINPDTTGVEIEKQPNLDRFFRWLFKKKNPARVEDKAIYNNILEVIGDGDLAKGRSLYLSECRANQGQNYQYTWMKGTPYECLEPWVSKVIKKSREYSQKDAREKNKWMTEILFVLEEKIPLSSLLKFLGKENYAFYIDIMGFRSGDETAYDMIEISNTLGEIQKRHPYAGGLIKHLSEKSKIISTELDRTQADFQ